MAKCIIIPMVVVVVVLHIAAEANSTTSGAGVEAACKNRSDAKFCAELLKPYASQFVDNDMNKMGYAAISATLGQVQATRAYMVRQTTEPETTEKEREAVTECLGMLGNCDDSLRMASQEFDHMRAAKDDHMRATRRQTVMKMIDAAKVDLSACTQLLKNHTDLIAGRVVGEAARLSDRSVQACSVSKAFVHSN